MPGDDIDDDEIELAWSGRSTGRKFLMLYLGYLGGIDNDPDEALDWA